MKAWAVLALCALLVVGLSGCSSKKKDKEEEVVLPGGIRREDLARAELLVSDFPLRYSFPGQLELDEKRLYFNGSFGPADGMTGVELPTDEGPIDYGSLIERFDLGPEVPAGQPAEIRLELKWVGDPGRAGDLDIWVDVPGTRDAYSPGRVDESWNFNIGTKTRYVNAVHVEGKPFEVGIQLSNGRVVHPDGMSYSLQVDLYYGQNVLAPGVPYAIQVPANATGIVVESEPLTGSEHIQSEFVIIGPNDQLVRHMTHDDITTETLFISINEPGEYVIFSQNMHGGFLRIETDVPNEQHLVRMLEMTETVVSANGGTPAPGTFAEMGNGVGNSWGSEGTFDVSGNFPLDIELFMAGDSGSSGAINVTSPKGWFGTTYATANQDSGTDRVGSDGVSKYNRANLALGSYSYGVVANSPGMEMTITVLSYTR